MGPNRFDSYSSVVFYLVVVFRKFRFTHFLKMLSLITISRIGVRRDRETIYFKNRVSDRP